MYRLAHKHRASYITCKDWQHALTTYYRQWRDKDGAIAWDIEYIDEDGSHVVIDIRKAQGR